MSPAPEPPRPEVAVGAVALDAGRILLIRRGHGPAAGTWSLPGGRVEPGETLHDAVVREVREEAGLEVVVDRFLGYVERLGDDPEPHHFVILDFVVTVADRSAMPCAGGDAAEAAWIPLADLPEYRLAPGLLEFLRDHAVLDDPGGA